MLTRWRAAVLDGKEARVRDGSELAGWGRGDGTASQLQLPAADSEP